MSRQWLNRRRVADRLISIAALTLLSASCWWAWMAWDDSYHRDPATGTTSGPYQAWQVIGCVVCLIALGVGATVRLATPSVVAVMSVTFTAAWSVTAASRDGTGLWVVGAMLIFVGMLCGAGMVSGLTAAVLRARKIADPRTTSAQ